VQFVLYAIVCTSCANTAYSLGLCLSCVIKDPNIVVKLQPMIFVSDYEIFFLILFSLFNLLLQLPFMLFSGFFLNTSSVPDYFIWLEHVSFMKYAFGGAGNAIFEVGYII
jgi:ATP-binding cassette subfamily G (WHITE) protein 1/ATP-binding cassette subfamily G (WHITE) protein 2